MITEKQFEEFIKELKWNLWEIAWAENQQVDNTMIQKEIDNLYKKYSKDIHSPQSIEYKKLERLDGKNPLKATPSNKCLNSEDTKEDLCECGHERIEHHNDKGFCQELSLTEEDAYCPCKKFKPSSKKGERR